MNPLGVLLSIGVALALGGIMSTAFSSASFATTNRRPVVKRLPVPNAKRAFVACAAPDASYRLFRSAGVFDCRTAFRPYGGDRACRVACLGYGTCVDICPRNALQRGVGGKPLVGDDCDGCGLCAEACPTGAIIIIDATGPDPKPCRSTASIEERLTYGSSACVDRLDSEILAEKALQGADIKLNCEERNEKLADHD